MTKDNLEDKSRKAVISINEKVNGIYDVLRDLSLKLCHVIKSQRDYYNSSEGHNYYKQYASLYNLFNPRPAL